MKGLFLPGFKMPKCCENCIANDDNWKCNVLDRLFDYDTMAERRFGDCPLIEVELVDQEELITPLNMIGGYLRRVNHD